MKEEIKEEVEDKETDLCYKNKGGTHAVYRVCIHCHQSFD